VSASAALQSAPSVVDGPAVASRPVGAPVIRVDRLRKTYGSIVAVDDISFEVPAGAIFGMVGPNGAGKTTTIECIEGQRDRDSGRVEVLGADPFRAAAAFRRQIGVQLQEASLPPRMKAWEAVDLFASFYNLRVDVRAELAVVGLADKFDAEFQKLSGGQKQRLFIALALVNHPRLVFLDELTTGLDPHARQQMWDLVRGIRDAGRTVVLTTHSMAEAEQLCDSVAIFNHGRIVALDSPAGLIRSFGAQSRIQFAVDGPVDLEALAAIAGVTNAVRSGDRVTVTGSETIFGMVIGVLDAGRCRYHDVRTIPATLEDVFLALTVPRSEG
jgi:ABC-2 type transport system ATP-binding protein